MRLSRDLRLARKKRQRSVNSSARLLSSDDPFNNHAACLCRTQREPIASNEKFDGIAERRAAKMHDFFAIGQSHFHQTNGDGILATDVEYAGFLTFIQ